MSLTAAPTIAVENGEAFHDLASAMAINATIIPPMTSKKMSENLTFWVNGLARRVADLDAYAQ